MKIWELVIKDILRRKRRVLYATLGIVIGVMTVVGLLTIAQAGQSRIYAQLEKYGANITVVPAIKSIDMELGDLRLGTLAVGENYISEKNIALIQEISDGEIRRALDIKDEGYIAIIAPKLYINAEIRGNAVTIVGIDPENEGLVKTWWKVGEGKYLDGSEQALSGAAAAELLGLKVGEPIPLKQGDVPLGGILEETGSGDDYSIFMPLATVQNLFGKQGLISSVEIRALCNACPAEVIAVAINQEIAGVRAVAVKQVAETEMGMLDKIRQLMLALAGVTVLVGGFGVMNTMMNSVHERIKDIGIMRAVGASRNQILRLLIYEAVAIGLAGGLAGYGAGTLLAYALGPLIFEGTAISWVGQFVPVSVALAVVISVLATLYPALRATRIRVADSFRSL